MGILDYTRGRIMARVGAQFQASLDRRVFHAVVRKSAVAPDMRAQSGLADLESIQQFLTSPVLLAFFDLPWTPIFIAGIFMFHPMLGWLAVGSGLLLVSIALANQFLSRRPQLLASQAGQAASVMSDQLRIEAEMVQSMGMRDAAFDRWRLLAAWHLAHRSRPRMSVVALLH
jgi:ABC-type protease/lipase transport system fused ATPase/permease subunit